MFELAYKHLTLKVSRHTIGNSIVFRVVFSDATPPLILSRTENPSGDRFWTSVPEGRQPEAVEIGALISNHLKSN